MLGVTTALVAGRFRAGFFCGNGSLDHRIHESRETLEKADHERFSLAAIRHAKGAEDYPEEGRFALPAAVRDRS